MFSCLLGQIPSCLHSIRSLHITTCALLYVISWNQAEAFLDHYHIYLLQPRKFVQQPQIHPKLPGNVALRKPALDSLLYFYVKARSTSAKIQKKQMLDSQCTFHHFMIHKRFTDFDAVIGSSSFA